MNENKKTDHAVYEFFIEKKFSSQKRLELWKMGSFPIEKRSEIKGAIKLGTSFKGIAIRCLSEMRTVKAIWDKYRQTGTVRQASFRETKNYECYNQSNDCKRA